VLAAIRALKTGKSTSGIVAEVYKALRHELAPLMVLQFNAARKKGALGCGTTGGGSPRTNNGPHGAR